MKEIAPLVCPECGATFTPHHHLQVFCTTDHRNAFHDRAARRGKVLVPLAQVMRLAKNGKNDTRSYALSQASALLDRFNAEDRAAGRRPDVIVESKRTLGWVAADLD